MADVTALQTAWIAAGAAVGGAGLTVLGGWISGRQSARTVRTQIAADAAERQREHSRAVEEAMRAERVSAHGDFSRTVREVARELNAARWQSTEAELPSVPDLLDVIFLGPPSELNTTMAKLTLVAGQESRTSARQLIDRLQEWGEAMSDRRRGKGNHAHEDRPKQRFQEALREYEEAARGDIGAL